MTEEQRSTRDTEAQDLETTAERRSGFLGADVLAAHGEEPSTGPAADDAAATGDAARSARADVPERTGASARSDAPAPSEEEGADTAVLLAGASVLPGPRSRAAAHVGAVVLSVLLVPPAWYLLADGGARLAATGGPWATGRPDVAGLLELAAGLLVLLAPLLAARWSSLGASVTGALVTLLGLPFLLAPAQTRDAVAPLADRMSSWHQLGANAAEYLLADATTGRLVRYGLALVLLGVVSHGARRQGRREEKARFDRARNREIASRRMAEARRRAAESRIAQVERRGSGPA